MWQIILHIEVKIQSDTKPFRFSKKTGSPRREQAAAWKLTWLTLRSAAAKPERDNETLIVRHI